MMWCTPGTAMRTGYNYAPEIDPATGIAKVVSVARDSAGNILPEPKICEPGGSGNIFPATDSE